MGPSWDPTWNQNKGIKQVSGARMGAAELPTNGGARLVLANLCLKFFDV